MTVCKCFNSIGFNSSWYLDKWAIMRGLSLVSMVLLISMHAYAQEQDSTNIPNQTMIADNKENSLLAQFYDAQQGASANDLVRRAIANNGEIAAARLDIERARARLVQAGLRPNPSVSFEQLTEKFTGTGSDRATGITFSLPIELGGKRERRLELAQAEVTAAEVEVMNRERRLANEIRIAYIEATAILRELEIIENIDHLNKQIGQVVEARVKEGDTAAIELSLIEIEGNRLHIRTLLNESHLQGTLTRLKSLTGMDPNESLRLREAITSPLLPVLPTTKEEAIEVAMRTRPDLKLAQQNEAVAQATLMLARAQVVPDIIPFTKYSFDHTITDLPIPLIPVPNRGRFLTFGFSIGLPIFNKNQGGKAEASITILQAQRRRIYVETVVRAEVSNAYERYQRMQSILQTFENTVITRTQNNVLAMHEAYKIGAFSIRDLLAEQRRLLDFQREFIEALTERYRAMVDLQTAIGMDSY